MTLIFSMLISRILHANSYIYCTLCNACSTNTPMHYLAVLKHPRALKHVDSHACRIFWTRNENCVVKHKGNVLNFLLIAMPLHKL